MGDILLLLFWDYLTLLYFLNWNHLVWANLVKNWLSCSLFWIWLLWLSCVSLPDTVSLPGGLGYVGKIKHCNGSTGVVISETQPKPDLKDIRPDSTWLDPICNWYRLLVYGFECHLKYSMFYVWFRDWFDTQYVLCLISSMVWYSVCVMCCIKISIDTW